MEKEFRLSELRTMDMDNEQKNILKMVDSKPFRFFLKWVLKDGEMHISEKGVFMNGKNASMPFLGKTQQEQMSKNGIKELFIKKDRMKVIVNDKETIEIILD